MAAPDPFNFAQLVDMFDDGAVVGQDNTNSDIKAYLSTGSLVMDWELTERRYRGGYPSGRMVEISGPEAAGKSTMVTHALINAQRGNGILIDWKTGSVDGRDMFLPQQSTRKMKPGLAILIDSEHKFSIDRAQRMGLNLDQLVRITGEENVLTFEQCIEEIEKVLNKLATIPYFQTAEVPICVALDSLAQAPIEAELEGNGLQDGIASKARKIRMAMRRMTSKISAMNIFMLFTNHIHDRIGAPGSVSGGGRGLKFAASLRLGIKKAFKDGDLKSGPEQVGTVAEVKCEKSSFCVPPDAIRVPIRYLAGIDQDRELLEFFLNGEPCVTAVEQPSTRVEITMPDGTKKSGWAGQFSEMLNDIPGSREYLMSIFERTMLGERPVGERKKKKAKDESATP